MQIGELLAEALEVTKGALVDKTDQSVQFQKRILQRSGGEEQFWCVLERLLQCVGNDVRRLIHIPQPVCFINDHKVPVRGTDIRCFTARELVRANDDVLDVEGLGVALLDRSIIGLGFEDAARQEELFLQFLVPLLTEIGRRDGQEMAFALCPSLGKDEPRFDRLPQSHFIRKNGTFGKRRLERKQRSVDLMRVQVNLRVHERTCELLDTVRGTALRQLVGEILRVVMRQVHHNFTKHREHNVLSPYTPRP